jgi:alkanesulfonate monooxygenase SsuD/methylene tetrahydromethanopterin reductase-like flavin-dependent oxidoreductase (luciferase family)
MKVSLIAEGQEGVSWEQWLALAETCERTGIGGLYSSDHFLAVEDPSRGSFDMWGCICALAARTSTLRLGTNVTPVTFRHPIALSKIVVTADRISGGRIDLGLGIGSMEHEHRAFGIPFGSTGARFDLLEEQLEILHGLWTEDEFSFAGDSYRLEGATVNPKPVNGTVPITIGGLGKPRSAALAARWASRYNLPHPTPAGARECREALDRACEEIDRDPATLTLSIMCSAGVGHSAEQAQARADRVGERLPILEQFRDRWIVGTVEQAVEQLLAFRAAGVDEIMVQAMDHGDLANVELIGTELAPAVS